MKALVLGNKVVQIEEKSFEVHPSLQWIDIPQDKEVKVGYIWDGYYFSPPQQDKAELWIRLKRMWESYINNKYSLLERETIQNIYNNTEITQEQKETICQLYGWFNNIAQYYYRIRDEVGNGNITNLDEVDFSQFDKTMPYIEVLKLFK
jgi:hypothetical protein